MTTLPEESKWEEGIYEFHINDKATGYNPATGVDGISNLPWNQLANRTRFLKNLVEVEHNPDGSHKIVDNDFLSDTSIPESQLLLDYSTESLHARTESELAAITNITSSFENADAETIERAALLRKLLPESKKYTQRASAYELFIKEFSLMEDVHINLQLRDNLEYAAIDGDDSIDLETTEGLVIGEEYCLHNGDGGEGELVTIRAIFPLDKRVRCVNAVRKTRKTGVLSKTNLALAEDGARTVTGTWSYLSGWVDILTECESGSIYLTRDDIGYKEVLQFLEIQQEGSDEWLDLELSETISNGDGTVTDYWRFIPGGKKFRMRIEYTGSTAEYEVHNIVITANTNTTSVEAVRQPNVVKAIVGNGFIRIKGYKYGTLYEVPHAGTRVRLLSAPYITSPYAELDMEEVGTDYEFPLPENMLGTRQIYVQLQYIDAEGFQSKWSPVFAALMG